MATDMIRYDLLVQEALRGVVRKVLSDAARDGLHGEHHFFITFKTHAPGVQLSARMRNEYPGEMTIILQHQFWGLNVTEQGFEVGLSFHKVPETLIIPFDALTGFSDPSVPFGMKFETEAGANDAGEPAELGGRSVGSKPDSLSPSGEGEAGSAAISGLLPVARSETRVSDSVDTPESKVISIDAFRKKT